MKAVRALGVALAGMALLIGAASGSAAPKPGKNPAFKHYVACRDVPPNATPKRKLKLLSAAPPSHSCSNSSIKGAFFKSFRADVKYKVCVQFPTGGPQCASPVKAAEDKLYLNRLRTHLAGPNRVTWFADGKQVGAFRFRVRR